MLTTMSLIIYVGRLRYHVLFVFENENELILQSGYCFTMIGHKMIEEK